MDMLNFGIIGCGRISSRHAQALQELEKTAGVKLVAACDVVGSRAQHIVKTYGGTAYTDYRAVLARPDIDVITICTPSGLHSQMGQEAARAGKHVLVEKPISLNLADADALIETCDRNGVRLSVVLQNRYNPPMRDLQKVIDEGLLGRPLLANVTVRWYRPQEYYEDGWHGTWALDGGALMNQCIHHIDALRWLLGEVDTVVAYTATQAHQMEAEDVGIAILRFKNGVLATIEGSTVTYPENLEGSIAIFGEKASLKVGGTALNRKVIWKIAGQIEHERDILAREAVDPPSVYGYSHREQIAEFIQSIRENRSSATNGLEARKSLELVCAIYKSARERIEVKL